jgi:hypothetical protein
METNALQNAQQGKGGKGSGQLPLQLRAGPESGEIPAAAGMTGGGSPGVGWALELVAGDKTLISYPNVPLAAGNTAGAGM